MGRRIGVEYIGRPVGAFPLRPHPKAHFSRTGSNNSSEEHAWTHGLLAGNAAATQAATFVFFPLVFLAPTFMPRGQLQGWLQVAAAFNPTTYVLESMRGVLIGGWNPGQLASGFVVIGGLCIAATLWATRVARRTTSRR